MNIGMAKKPARIVLDTNILISALVYGGKPEQIYNLILNKELIAVISPILRSELNEILIKKFKFEFNRVEQLENIMRNNFLIVNPTRNIALARDEDDNRVLEAAVEGKCSYIITGDKDLLELKIFKNIRIVTPDTFLSNPLIG